MARKKSPWLTDASEGATGAAYPIATLRDFLKVPASRRCVCLREFHAWLHMQEAVPDLVCAAGDALGTPIPREMFQFDEAFVWEDDGKATISVEFKGLEEASSVDARLTDSETGKALGSATESSSSVPTPEAGARQPSEKSVVVQDCGCKLTVFAAGGAAVKRCATHELRGQMADPASPKE
jgi:hypothetical protein